MSRQIEKKVLDIQNRINKILEIKGLEQSELAVKAEIPPDTLSKAIKRGNLSTDIIRKLRDKIGVREEYLKKGEEPIFDEKLTAGIKNEQANDLSNHPLVKSYVSELETLRKYVALLEKENQRLGGGQ